MSSPIEVHVNVRSKVEILFTCDAVSTHLPPSAISVVGSSVAMSVRG